MGVWGIELAGEDAIEVLSLGDVYKQSASEMRVGSIFGLFDFLAS